jgi:hypothetical protein
MPAIVPALSPDCLCLVSQAYPLAEHPRHQTGAEDESWYLSNLLCDRHTPPGARSERQGNIPVRQGTQTA